MLLLPSISLVLGAREKEQALSANPTLGEELGLSEGVEAEGTFCDKQVCEGAGAVQLNGDCRGHSGKTGGRHSGGRMSQGLKCTKQPRNENMQSCPGGLTFWVAARSHR